MEAGIGFHSAYRSSNRSDFGDRRLVASCHSLLDARRLRYVVYRSDLAVGWISLSRDRQLLSERQKEGEPGDPTANALRSPLIFDVWQRKSLPWESA